MSREEGGHIKIVAKIDAAERTDLTPVEAVEFMRFSMLVGEAFKNAMTARGVEIVKLNYEDLGNWAYKAEYQARGDRPHLHLHIFGRVATAKRQIFPEAVQLPPRSSGFYDGFEPLNSEDVAAIKNEIERLARTEKYDLKNWSGRNIMKA
jgi:diadenosine tetraphosphate (Ap4A) HIT family hydrolase